MIASAHCTESSRHGQQSCANAGCAFINVPANWPIVPPLTINTPNNRCCDDTLLLVIVRLIREVR